MIFYISVTIDDENVYHSEIELQLENGAWRVPKLT